MMMMMILQFKICNIIIYIVPSSGLRRLFAVSGLNICLAVCQQRPVYSARSRSAKYGPQAVLTVWPLRPRHYSSMDLRQFWPLNHFARVITQVWTSGNSDCLTTSHRTLLLDSFEKQQWKLFWTPGLALLLCLLGLEQNDDQANE